MSDREANAEVTWPDHASSVYRQLDSTASCSICNDYYDTPLLLLCGHSCKSGLIAACCTSVSLPALICGVLAVCSSCIRSFIAHQEGQAKCPQCRAVCDERDLRPNISLRELVDKLLQVRPGLIAALRNPKAGHSRLSKRSESAERQDLPADKPASHKRQLRSSRQNNDMLLSSQESVPESPRKRQRTATITHTSAAAAVPVKSDSAAKANASASTSGLGQCPFCLKHFRAGRVLEAHANRCVDNLPAQQPAQAQPAEPDVKVTKVTKKGQRQPDLKVPAKIAFHLFNDKKLKEKLKDVNLPTTGKRKVSKAASCV